MNGAETIIAVQSGIPVHLIGRPGTGKTSFVGALGWVTGREVVTVIASIREPSDFAGLPVITKDDNVKFAPPSWATHLAELGKGILFLDELSTAPPAVQAALLRVIFERTVGELKLPDDIWIIAASNPTDTSSGTWTLSAALANRFVHIDWAVDNKLWIEGMIDGFKVDDDVVILPKDWEDAIPQYRSLVASFISARPTLLLAQPDNVEDCGKAWPSPRTWDYASRLLAACRVVSADGNVTSRILSGIIGEGAAIEFLTWERELDLPDPESLLADPDSFVLPKRADQVFAVLSSVAQAVKGHPTLARWNAGWIIMGVAAKGGKTDLAAIPAKVLAKANVNKKFPIPKDVKAFMPVLSAAGLMGK